jgi:hypothetical protein
MTAGRTARPHARREVEAMDAPRLNLIDLLRARRDGLSNTAAKEIERLWAERDKAVADLFCLRFDMQSGEMGGQPTPPAPDPTS